MMKQNKKIKTGILTAVIITVTIIGSVVYANDMNPVTPSPTSEAPNNLLMSSKDLEEPDTKSPASIQDLKLTCYESETPEGQWPYIQWSLQNDSDKIIIDYEITFLAYDEAGNPLELVWSQLPLTDGYKVEGYINQSEKSYSHSVPMSDDQILPSKKETKTGGWSLFDGWDPETSTHTVKHILASIKQITFQDGTTWQNPDYDTWLTTYQGKSLDSTTIPTDS